MTRFDPSSYLVNVGRGQYLEVKWRLLWLRHDCPDAVVETDLVAHDLTRPENPVAVFRARVAIPGGGSATGWGSESAADFPDYLEKAETKALGRALAALGFGTQFCPDFDTEPSAIVDSPVAPRSPRPSPSSSPRMATKNQIAYLRDLAEKLGVRSSFPDELLGEMTADEATRTIDDLKAKIRERSQQR